MNWAIVAFRSLKGLSEMNMRPDIGRRAAPSAAPGEAAAYCTSGSLLIMARTWVELRLHRLEGDVLVGLDGAADPPGVLLGEEALGDHR